MTRRLRPEERSTTRTCRTCGATFDAFGPFMVHARAHVRAGEAKPTGRRGTAGEPRTRTRARRGRPIESIMAGDGPAGEPRPAEPRVSGGEGLPFVEQAETPTGPTRETIAAALTDSDLADLLVMLSRALAEADGAGEAGVLLRSEAALISRLIHESTVSFIVRRFEGNVERAKLALAVVVLLFARGRVHAQAIYRRTMAERQARAIDATMAAQAAQAPEPEYVPEPPVESQNGAERPGPIDNATLARLRGATIDLGLAPA